MKYLTTLLLNLFLLSSSKSVNPIYAQFLILNCKLISYNKIFTDKKYSNYYEYDENSKVIAYTHVVWISYTNKTTVDSLVYEIDKNALGSNENPYVTLKGNIGIIQKSFCDESAKVIRQQEFNYTLNGKRVPSAERKYSYNADNTLKSSQAFTYDPKTNIKNDQWVLFEYKYKKGNKCQTYRTNYIKDQVKTPKFLYTKYNYYKIKDYSTLAYQYNFGMINKNLIESEIFYDATGKVDNSIKYNLEFDSHGNISKVYNLITQKDGKTNLIINDNYNYLCH